MSVVGRLSYFKLLKNGPRFNTTQTCTLKTEAFSQWTMKKAVYTGIGLVAGGIGTLVYALEQSVSAYDYPVHPPHYPWSHHGIISSLDHASIRRGFEVYRNVCSACHSMKFIPFRRLVNVSHTEAEAKEIAADTLIKDGPNEFGEYFMRPGRLSDYFPSPYENEEAAKAANNGAAPPDLSLMVMAREAGENYVFSLLNGYHEPPVGVEVAEGSYYNVYFQGSIIAMAPPLYNNVIEYSDGTPATVSQLAKDVTTFLTWTAEPNFDKRKLWVIKFNLYMSVFLAIVYYINRHKWVTIRTREVTFRELKK